MGDVGVDVGAGVGASSEGNHESFLRGLVGLRFLW